MTVSMGMLIFAGLAYALEKDEPGTTFYTLPQTLYWAIITMTSTGRCLVMMMMMMMMWVMMIITITMTSTGRSLVMMMMMMMWVMMIIIITMTSTGDQYGTATKFNDNT